MCGISGIIEKHDRPVDARRIERMTELVAHRGPDDSGYYFFGALAFGHRRLSILDLSRNGHQPMSYLDRWWITYNGEIYNYLEVRRELEREGYRFATGTDTEVVLAAYAAWGEQCLRRFNGMWAFAIHDRKENTVFLARDRFGVKPLYYAEDGERFEFGSEIKQLLPFRSRVRANQRIVLESLLTRFENHTEDTFFEGIRCVPPSHFLRYDLSTHRYTLHRYYTLEQSPQAPRAMADAVAEFRAALEDSVRIRLRADVVVGTCLSGGLDSSAVSALAGRMYSAASGKPFTGIHAKSIQSDTDESAYAEKVGRHLGLQLRVVEPTTQDFRRTIDELVYTQEEPFGSPSMFMGWHVFREAKSLGCKVMLNGQGGDEVLLGYERYYAAMLSKLPLLRMLREMRAQARNSRLELTELLMYFFYFTNADLRIRRLKARSYVRDDLKSRHDFDSVRRSAASFRELSDLQIFEICTLQLPHLLRYEDRNSMRHSVETRLPFLDYRVVELGVSLPPDFKIRDGWTKYVLRKGIEDLLPGEIAWRRNKLGFEAPEAIWLGSCREQMKAEIRNSAILAEITDLPRLLERFDRLSLKDQWAYFNLAAWERVYNVAWS